MSPKSFSMRIFCQDGHADGVKIIAKSKWPGRALVIPRTSLPTELERSELKAPGVYILVGPIVEGELPKVFIGAAELVCHELREQDSREDFWKWTIVFAAKDDTLTMEHVGYLEKELFALARKSKTSQLLSSRPPGRAPLSIDELAYADAFLEHVLTICPVIGLRAFEPPRSTPPTASITP